MALRTAERDHHRAHLLNPCPCRRIHPHMKPIRVVLYKYTGPQGLFTIPESWCRECDLLVRATERAIAESGLEVDFRIRPWFLWMAVPFLRHFGWHAPILVVGGRMVSQGIVAKESAILEALQRAARGSAAPAA